MEKALQGIKEFSEKRKSKPKTEWRIPPNKKKEEGPKPKTDTGGKKMLMRK